MATEKIIYEADTARLCSAIEKVINKEVKLRRGIKQTKGETKKAEGAFTQLGTNASNQLKNMAVNAVGVTAIIAGVVKAFSAVTAEINATKNAMNEMAEKGETFATSAIGLANQMGQSTTAAGQKLSSETLATIQKAGRYGPDWEKGKAAGVAGHVAFGTPGEVLSGKAMEMTKLGAEWGGYKQIGAEETGGLFKVMAQMGVKDKDEMAKRLRQFGMAYEKALSVDPGANIGGVTRFMAGHVAEGGGVEAGLGTYIQSIKTSGSEQEAAQQLRRMTALMRGDKMQETLAGRLGIDVGQFQKLPMDERIAAFGKFAAEGSEAEIRKAGLAPKQIGFAARMYGKGGFERIEQTKQWLSGATAEETYANLAGFGGTPYAIRRDTETDTALLAGEVSDPTMRGRKVLEHFAERRKMQREGAEKDTIGWSAAFMSQEYESKLLASRDISSRGRALKGKVPDKELRSFWELNSNAYMDPLTLNARDVGEATQELERLEKLAAAADKLDKAADKISNAANKITGAPAKNSPAPAVPASPFN